ncbi:hypothetical protein ABIE13_000767 [Ottowia thiooxydans]|uniref:Uncharacterized protein n=1 Tax=Ottowia thiooxydans TaxID=219182 RepID=A0ABV2Q525_9BURK
MESIDPVCNGIQAIMHNCERLGTSSRFFHHLDGFQDILNMTWNLEATPFLHQQAFGVDKEGAALNAFDLLAVHDLVFHHTEHVAHFFFGVSNQLERQLKLGLEVFVRFHVIARNAEHNGSGFHEVFVLVAKLHGLGCATGRIVFGIEIKNQRLAEVRGVGNFDVACGDRFKFGQGFVDNDRHMNFNLSRDGFFLDAARRLPALHPYFIEVKVEGF